MRLFGVYLLVAVQSSLAANQSHGAPRYTFEADVAPIFRNYCWKCHGGGGLAGGLDLRRTDLIVRGGNSGPAIVPGNPERSLLFQKLVQGAMPPKKTTEDNVVYAPLQTNAQQQEVIRAWIKQGAAGQWRPRALDETEDPPLSGEDRSWWAFVPPQRVPPPGDPVNGSAVDRYLLAALKTNGLAFARPAEPRTMLTRLYLDLTGLPPSPDVLREFLTDVAPKRYERKVRELLQDVGFGRHWGQYWLDAAGYSDVTGSDNDGAIIKLHDGKWRYRDYVIDALNDNMPYDQFVREQIAGDELSDWRNAASYSEDTRRQLIATGFLRQAADTSGEKELNTPDIRNRVLLDTVQMVSSSLMGVTIHCAQCHSHKFDPLSQADYYRLVAIFEPAINPRFWRHPGTRHLWSVPDHQRLTIDRANDRLRAEIAQANKKLQGLKEAIRERVVAERLKWLPPSLRIDLKASAAIAKEKRTPVQAYLSDRLGSLLRVDDLQNVATEAERQSIAALNASAAQKKKEVGSYFRIQALWESEPAAAFYLFQQGAYDDPGPSVKPGFPRVMRTVGGSSRPPEPIAGAATSGRRKAFANWLLGKDHPLTARVYVNRVWQRYFGVGLVATPDNFGRSGRKPTNQALLDWLAIDFMESGWDVKRLHETIVLSKAYRQASRDSGVSNLARARKVDPTNQLLWKMPLRRLESGVIRDRTLAVSGKLNSRAGGPPVELSPEPNGYVRIDRKKLSRPEDEFRHSIYILARRNYHLTQLNVFDQPVLAHNCTRRNSSAGVAQALVRLNSTFTLEHAEYFADRVLRETEGAQTSGVVKHAFECALCRPPDATEQGWAEEFVGKRNRNTANPERPYRDRLAELCHVLLNTNEFLYAH